MLSGTDTPRTINYVLVSRIRQADGCRGTRHGDGCLMRHQALFLGSPDLSEVLGSDWLRGPWGSDKCGVGPAEVVPTSWWCTRRSVEGSPGQPARPYRRSRTRRMARRDRRSANQPRRSGGQACADRPAELAGDRPGYAGSRRRSCPVVSRHVPFRPVLSTAPCPLSAAHDRRAVQEPP